MTFILVTFLTTYSCWSQVDQQANSSVKKLYRHLNEVSDSVNTDQKILIGQQNAFSEGRGWRLSNQEAGQPLKSDMHEAAGIHPNVLGVDFDEIGPWNNKLFIGQMREVHKRGGVVTISWHMPALINDGKGDGSSKDTTTRIVKRILPGGDHHHVLIEKLDRLAEFFLEIKDIPVVFRPWHEHNYSWFWWGKKHSTKEEYIELWRITATHLMKKGVHNLLYAYSPNHVKKDYLDRYPGDEYIDILGFDHYYFNRIYDIAIIGLRPLTNYKKDIVWLCEEAARRNKIPAVTELGLETSHYKNFWTKYFGLPHEKEGMEQITGSGRSPRKGPAYIMLWRNDKTSPKHYFGPVPGHKNNEDFKKLLSKDIYLGLDS